MTSTRGFHRYAAPVIAVLFLAGLTLIFGWLLDKQRNPNQSNLTQITSDGGAEVVLKRNSMGHYIASGYINEQPVEFFLDTGATLISVPQEVADQLGLEKGPAFPVRTANGNTEVYATKLAQVSLGKIALGNVPASINPAMEGQHILLGMSFLKHLELTQRNGVLRIRVPQGNL